jgi:hypothetical protein
MAKYCDSAVLERNWFNWLLASSVPSLDENRQSGLLWTKVVGRAKDSDGKEITKDGKTFPDACAPYRLHCLALGMPVYFITQDGVPSNHCTVGPKGRKIAFDKVQSELTLDSNSELHNLDNTFAIRDEVIPTLKAEGYQKEVPRDYSWELMLCDINSMCHGIASKFHPPNEEELHELANDAIIQVINKLRTRRLVYIPGKAPVFNLLTTTIFRCMYSICNRKKQQRKGSTKFMGDAKAGVLPDNIRSFRIVSGSKSKVSLPPGQKAIGQD